MEAVGYTAAVQSEGLEIFRAAAGFGSDDPADAPANPSGDAIREVALCLPSDRKP